MPQEIERKFLVTGEYKPQAYAHSRIVQGYISSVRGRTVRVRIRDERGFLTIKGASNESGTSRYEWEKEIPLCEARELLKLCEPGIIDKTRYLVRSGRHVFEVDEFYGENEGLTVAEVELSSEDEPFVKPAFIGREVTGDVRYYNSQLMKHPSPRGSKPIVCRTCLIVMEKLYDYLPRELVTFLLVTVFSLLIGLSQRKISLKREGETTLFGTDRTFTFIGILGYLLYILDPTGYRLFMGGGAILGLLLGLNYYVKQSQYHVFGVTTIIIALITYCIAPIVATQPSWFYVMVIVTVLLFTELKHTFTELAQRMKNDEMITLAKFLAISGIILPMLPNENLIPGINLTPYSIWLATVVVSGISYLSYLLKRYVFHESGILVSGIVGGLYSSTATISVLARKSRKASVQDAPEYVAAMLLAVSMMFLRFLILIGIFSRETLLAIYPYLLIMSVVTAAVAWYLHSKRKRVDDGTQTTEDEDSSNPLEFKVALIFAMLFVVFTILTHYTLVYAGTGGLNLLSFISGFSDITPFILNLLQGTGSVAVLVITACSMQAIVSNIAVNMCYALFFAGGKSPLRPWILGGFGSVIAANICLLLFFYFL